SGSPLAFGGGSGAGVTVSPVCFLVIGKDGSANILGINAQASDTVDRLVEMIPGAINKVSNFVSGFKGKTEDTAEAAEPLSGDE
ncbi:GerW family sporulation protein, partial [Agathobaculum sp.]